VFVAFGIQHVTCVLLSFVSCLVVKYFLSYLVNGAIKKKAIEHRMCVLILFTVPVLNISHSKKI